MTAPLFEIMPWHERLEAERRSGSGRLFISDYNGAHPFVEEYLGDLAKSAILQLGDVTRYALIDEDQALRAKIVALHERYDGVTYSPGQVLAGSGSSSFLATICTWLMMAGYTRVHYVPPLYYTFAFLLQRYGIEPVPVTRGHAFEADVELELPDERTVLLLTDPVWYAGRRVPARLLDAVRDWQDGTGSLVFVDGTFQYMRWDGGTAEASATLRMDQTLRLVSPTKYLSLHGYRSAYLLTPARYRPELAELHLNLHGDGPLSDRMFAHRAFDLMLGDGNHALMHHVRDNYRRLVDGDALGVRVPIETGYFLFTSIRAPQADFLGMSAEFFELAGYPDHMRVNLLNSVAIDALIAGSRGGGQEPGSAPPSSR